MSRTGGLFLFTRAGRGPCIVVSVLLLLLATANAWGFHAVSLMS